MYMHSFVDWEYIIVYCIVELVYKHFGCSIQEILGFTENDNNILYVYMYRVYSMTVHD